jgi:hypothetical protein
MARTYREIAIQEMLRTVEEAMSQAINWWGDLPPPMKEAIEQFRTQLGAAIDSVEFVRRALDRQVHETDRGKGPAWCLLHCMSPRPCSQSDRVYGRGPRARSVVFFGIASIGAAAKKQGD